VLPEQQQQQQQQPKQPFAGGAGGAGVGSPGAQQMKPAGAAAPAAAQQPAPTPTPAAVATGTAAAAAEGGIQTARSRAVGAPVTTPGVVKTKAGRRGAIGPLLKMLRAQGAAAADQA
jgi:hypothetical protein